jgi:hypothetical protein
MCVCDRVFTVVFETIPSILKKPNRTTLLGQRPGDSWQNQNSGLFRQKWAVK